MRLSMALCAVIFGVLLCGCRKQVALVQDVPEAPSITLPAVSYPWMAATDSDNALANRVRVPAGYERVVVQAESFGEWLRFLPLKPGQPPVLLYNGQRKVNQQAHVAVVKLDVGPRDLQQCADAVMRLRGEYLYSRKRYAYIHFNFTSGARADFGRWAAGYRPLVRGNSVRWVRSARADSSHASFRAYLDTVFTYAGTASLSKELRPVPVREMRIGDVFIHGGFPGHAVIVVDMAEDRANGKKFFLLAQSYLPAQEMHLLRNPADERRSPWYALDFGDILETPEYTFTADELKRVLVQKIVARWKSSVKALKRDAYTLYLACRDPRVSWGVRLLALGVVAYAFSPIDLIPDWIPVLGYLDDLILVPLGILLVIHLMPRPVLAECRERAEALMATGKPVGRIAAVCIIVLWVLGAGAMAVWLLSLLP